MVYLEIRIIPIMTIGGTHTQDTQRGVVVGRIHHLKDWTPRVEGIHMEALHGICHMSILPDSLHMRTRRDTLLKNKAPTETKLIKEITGTKIIGTINSDAHREIMMTITVITVR